MRRQDYPIPRTCPVIKFPFLNSLLVKPDAAGCLPVEQIPVVRREEIERCITDEMKVDGNLCKQGERECVLKRRESWLSVSFLLKWN